MTLCPLALHRKHFSCPGSDVRVTVFKTLARSLARGLTLESLDNVNDTDGAKRASDVRADGKWQGSD